jgi:hypothetical protein
MMPDAVTPIVRWSSYCGDCPCPLLPGVLPAGFVAGGPGVLPAGFVAGGPGVLPAGLVPDDPGVLPAGFVAGGPPRVLPAGVVAGGPGVLPAGFVAGFPPLSVDDVPSDPVLVLPEPVLVLPEPVLVLSLVLVPGLGIVAQNASTVSPFAVAAAINRENATDDSADPLDVFVDDRPSGAKYAVHNP